MRAVALAGFCARGRPVLIQISIWSCSRGSRTIEYFGPLDLVEQRDFGDVRERPLRRRYGVEVEVGPAPLSWTDVAPLDAGTARVVRDGFAIVLDTNRVLVRLTEAVDQPTGHDE